MTLGIELLQPLISGTRSSDITDIITNMTIPAGFHQHPLRQMSQHLPGFCRAVGDGDGLRTAHGRDQLLPEDLNKFGRTVFFCFLMTLGIELLQPLISGTRSSDITDVITNMTGGILGYGLYLAFRPAAWWR